MRHGRTLSNLTFRLRERLCVIFNEKNLPFLCFFYRDRSVSIQTRNLRTFASEAFKDSKWLAPDIFPNLLISLVFSWTQVRSEFNGTEAMALIGPKIWNLFLVTNQKKYLNVFWITVTCNYYTVCIGLIS